MSRIGVCPPETERAGARSDHRRATVAVRVDAVQAQVASSVRGLMPRSRRDWERLRDRVTGEVGRPCLGRPTSEHFPPSGTVPPSAELLEARRAEARRLCAGCPVLLECRAVELAGGEPWGVWGGVCEWDLREVARALNAGCWEVAAAGSDEAGAGGVPSAGAA